MDRRITASLTGCALCASGFFAGVSVAPTPEASNATAACGSATGSDGDVILCRSSDAEPSPFAQPADEALRARLNDAMLVLERQGRLAAFTAVPLTDPARIPDLPEASLQGGPLDPPALYQQLAAATVMIHIGFKCDRCANWHGGVVSGFVIHPDGWVMTAGHVLRDLEANRHLSVMLHDESLHPIAGVAIIDDEADVAVFKIDATNLAYLPLAASAPCPGAPVSVLSHPNGHYYVLTRGIVSRLLDDSAQPRARLQITAPFAIGSSGGSVVDDACRVVGLALSTETIYADPQDQKNPQLVIPTCTPVEALRAAIAHR